MDLPKFHPNERVDLGDVEFLSEGQLGEFQRTFTNLIVGEATMRVLDGFDYTIQSATVLQVALGKAALAENRNTVVRYGQLVGGGSPVEGVASQNVSFSGLPVANYGVYVRFIYGDGQLANRAFWDTITDLEEVQAVNTRKVASWQVVVASDATAPGAEWYKLCTVAWDASDLATSTITDRRTFLFEGPADSSPQTFRPTWGAGNDRNANRALYGVKTLERFASAVLKKIEEIQSDTPATRWWSAPAEPLSKKVSRFGDLTLMGNYQITGELYVTGLVSLGDDVIVGADLIVVDELSVGGFASFTKRARVYASDTSTAGPDPDTITRASLIIENTASTVGAATSLFFLHAGADALRDGVVLYGRRTATPDEDVQLVVAGIEDSAFAQDIFVFDTGDAFFAKADSLGTAYLGQPTNRWTALYANEVVSVNTARAWARFSLDGGSPFSPSIYAEHNVATVLRQSAIAIRVTFSSAFVDDDYVVTFSPEGLLGASGTWHVSSRDPGGAYFDIGFVDNTGSIVSFDGAMAVNIGFAVHGNAF